MHAYKSLLFCFLGANPNYPDVIYEGSYHVFFILYVFQMFVYNEINQLKEDL